MSGEDGLSSMGAAGRSDGAQGPEVEATEGPLMTMKRAHDEKLQMCKALEAIADALPDGVDRIECLRLANALVPTLRNIHRYEEKVIFPAFQAARGDSTARRNTIRRLCAEHIEDECFADEVTEILLGLGHGKPVENPEAVGFMLRGLFETMRRHIAFEAEHVFPAICAGCD